MLLGMLCIILGYQAAWTWAGARIHGWTSGILPKGTYSHRIFKSLYLERGLIAGLAMCTIGLGLNGWLASTWYQTGMGDLDVQVTIRLALWGFTMLVLGGQTIFGSFFLSLLSMTENARKLAEETK